MSKNKVGNHRTFEISFFSIKGSKKLKNSLSPSSKLIISWHFNHIICRIWQRQESMFFKNTQWSTQGTLRLLKKGNKASIHHHIGKKYEFSWFLCLLTFFHLHWNLPSFARCTAFNIAFRTFVHLDESIPLLHRIRLPSFAWIGTDESEGHVRS